MSFNSIPVNGWPQLKELDELARKVGNMPTFTSSDKEAIADLISNAQALIDVAEDGATGVPFDNTGTDFTSTDVQAAIEEAATMGAGGDTDYSTTEAEVGTWLDGSKIYKRSFNFETALVVGASSWVATGISAAGIGRIIRAESCNISAAYYPVMADYDSDEVKLLSCRDGNISVSYLTIWYTKATAETRKRGK